MKLFAAAIGLAAAILCLSACSKQSDSVADSEFREQALPQVVTLSPHLAELVFAVGAGSQVVGISAYTDFPEAAKPIAEVGDAFYVDEELLTQLKPDLILAWEGGTPPQRIDRLRELGYTVNVIETSRLSDISKAMRHLGDLLQQSERAEVAAAQFESRLSDLRIAQRGKVPVTVFYQLNPEPLYTVGDQHFLNDALQLCNAQNIFSDLTDLAAIVSVEAVVQRDPEVILAPDDSGDDAFSSWQRWQGLQVNKQDNYYLLPANSISRATPRVIDGITAMCDALDTARQKRS